MKNKKKTEKVRQLSQEELIEEERKLQKYRKIIKKLWAVYGLSVILYLSNGLVVSSVTADIEKPEPITTKLNQYKHSEEYKDYISDIQRDIVASYECGEIDIDEFDRLVEITKDEAHFEEFLRSLDNDYVQEVIAKNDDLEGRWDKIGKTYAGINIASLVTLLGASIPLGVYRIKEDSIEEERKKRAEALESDAEGTEMGD